MELNIDEFRMFTLASIRMDEDNNLYFLAGTDDEMRLMKVNTQKDYEINNEELYNAIEHHMQALSVVWRAEYGVLPVCHAYPINSPLAAHSTNK